jgi:hypothetical protein
MRLIREEFEHAESAQAFVDGIELVNDGDHISAHEPRPENGKYVVYVHDWDREDEDDTCPICTAEEE